MTGIRIKKIWSDQDVVEFRVDVADGRSLFSVNVYVDHQHLADTVSGLDTFKRQVHGGLFNLHWGEFGPEYAGGGLHARFHFPKPGRVFISCRMESEYEDFSMTKVASTATLFLKTEPALLDRFIEELRALSSGSTIEAEMETIQSGRPD